MKNILSSRLIEVRDALNSLLNCGVDKALDDSVNIISNALLSKKPLLICGNGGSASDAMHIAGELVGRFLIERQACNVIALSANPSILTAWANDYSFDTIFSRQVQAYSQPGGILLGISTSGKSVNIIEAAREAKKFDMSTILLTGAFEDGDYSIWDVVITTPSRLTPRIQEMHLILYHLICEQIELRLLK